MALIRHPTAYSGTKSVSDLMMMPGVKSGSERMATARLAAPQRAIRRKAQLSSCRKLKGTLSSRSKRAYALAPPSSMSRVALATGARFPSPVKELSLRLSLSLSLSLSPGRGERFHFPLRGPSFSCEQFGGKLILASKTCPIQNGDEGAEDAAHADRRIRRGVRADRSCGLFYGQHDAARTPRTSGRAARRQTPADLHGGRRWSQHQESSGVSCHLSRRACKRTPSWPVQAWA